MKRLIKLAGVSLVAASLTSCVMGRDFSNAGSLQSPYGPFVNALVDSVAGKQNSGTYRTFDGELFEVRPDGFVLLLQKKGGLVFIKWDVAQMKVPSLGISNKYGPLTPENRELLRLASRHPYGLPPEQLNAVLASLGQAAMLEVR